MKVGLMTYHCAYNYGSFLQAYALQKYITNVFNVECEIIDYRKDAQKEFYSIKKNNTSLRNIIKNFIVLPHQKELKKRNEMFERIIADELVLSRKYTSSYELMRENCKYDLYICGSDQIWNDSILDFDDMYLLSFVDKKIKKISYAVSMGGNPEETFKSSDIFGKYLPYFSAISVRENEAKRVLKRFYSGDIEITVDPTLLNEYNMYDTLIKKEYLNSNLPKNKFIFFYSICYDENMIDRVIEFSKEYGMPIYMVFTGSLRIFKCKKKGIKVIYDATVADFLFLIKNATLVFSSSFHGTVFSILYKKDFYVINELKNGIYLQDARMKSLLDCLEISDRMIDNKIIINSINYQKVFLNLQKMVTTSKEYLEKNIKDLI